MNKKLIIAALICSAPSALAMEPAGQKVKVKAIDTLYDMLIRKKKADIQTAEEFLNNEPNVDLNAGLDGGRTLLHDAAEMGKKEVCTFLLEQGAQVDVLDGQSRTPLHHAAAWGTKKVCELLLENEANVRTADKNGKTPLHMAAEWGTEEVCALLLENEAYINDVDNNGMTPLYYAIKASRPDMCTFLLEQGAYSDTFDKEHRTPLKWATQCDGPLTTCKSLMNFMKRSLPDSPKDALEQAEKPKAFLNNLIERVEWIINDLKGALGPIKTTFQGKECSIPMFPSVKEAIEENIEHFRKYHRLLLNLKYD